MDLQRAPAGALFFAHACIAGLLFLLRNQARPYGTAFAKGTRLGVDPLLIRAARNLGASDVAIMREVILPGALPGIISGLKVTLAISWSCVISAEMVAAQTGLGAMIMDARQLSRTEIVIAGMAVIGVAGFLSDYAVLALGRRLLAWSPQHG